ncbi:hypothetical protein [Clostridium chauvoei]|uniref:Uncharacterized protein n=2 Tax=Clostridium chauvoei TaxID=46867 RepID=S6F6X5_9CLOT|nr:hypothetical protein [Clostridium chauvoei]MBX7281341.1 hypothetical protein [Clostridium chauvoei]MBX7283823.1 hypothetical protein [Clostridium chauvoei]MBX7286430.1 hypothetical protein [Clostridium chauvoei]MBX7288883.1 hypothetical protein [Clostridium chauvoei]MBX7291425.1 hypothetical protein [Clostridium chauvoei]
MLSFSKKSNNIKSFGYPNKITLDDSNTKSYFNDGKENHSYLKSREY